MKKKILVSVDAGETRVAVFERKGNAKSKVAELYVERRGSRSIVGNIYKGVVDNVLPGMEAAFVDIGLDRAAFLHASDVHPLPVMAEVNDNGNGNGDGTEVVTRHEHRAPPPALSADLLTRGIAHRLQENRYGPLSSKAVRDIVRFATGPVEMGNAARPEISLRAGTRLVRSWRGTSYTVEVLEGGFLFEGKRHTSLTIIARQITGAAWSGPRFFGLTKPGKSHHA